MYFLLCYINLTAAATTRDFQNLETNYKTTTFLETIQSKNSVVPPCIAEIGALCLSELLGFLRSL